MKMLLLPLALTLTTAALAQTDPPKVGDRPLLVVKSKSAARMTAASPKDAAPKARRPASLAGRLQACLEIEDGSKGRLDCYDAVVKPNPKPKPPKAKSVMDCSAHKEEDERLTCFNDFVERLPKLPQS